MILLEPWNPDVVIAKVSDTNIAGVQLGRTWKLSNRRRRQEKRYRYHEQIWVRILHFTLLNVAEPRERELLRMTVCPPVKPFGYLSLFNGCYLRRFGDLVLTRSTGRSPVTAHFKRTARLLEYAASTHLQLQTPMTSSSPTPQASETKPIQ